MTFFNHRINLLSTRIPKESNFWPFPTLLSLLCSEFSLMFCSSTSHFRVAMHAFPSALHGPHFCASSRIFPAQPPLYVPSLWSACNRLSGSSCIYCAPLFQSGYSSWFRSSHGKEGCLSLVPTVISPVPSSGSGLQKALSNTC